MGISLSRLLADERDVAVDFQGSEINVTYRVSGYTPLFESMILSFAGRPDRALGLSDLICKLVVRWDITDDDGVPIAISTDSLSVIPAAVLDIVLTAVMRDMTTDHPKADVSSDNT